MKKVLQKSIVFPKLISVDLKIKLLAVLFILSFIAVHANSYSQKTKLSLNLNDVSIEEVINVIESQTEFEFIFNTKVVNPNRRVTIRVKNKKVKEILKRIFSNSKTVFEIENHKILLKKDAGKVVSIQKEKRKKIEFQQIFVKGRVVDESNNPVVDASVAIRGTTKGTTTDLDGNFTLNIEGKNVVLEISSLGFETKTLSVEDYSQKLVIVLKEDAFTLNDVVVTSRKREENLKDVPISVTAISGSKLASLDAQDITAIAGLSPNVNFSYGGTSSGSSSAAVVYIRGVGQNDFVPTVDPGVGIYLDGVYLGRSVGAVLDLVDTKRVEVLRGPQGTLFGRNSVGGAISLISNDPKDTFSGSLSATVGSDSRTGFIGTFHLPLSKRVKTSISALYKKRDGYVKRLLVGDKLGDENVFGIKTNIVFEPNDKIKFKAVFDYSREREASAAEEQLSAEGKFPSIVNKVILKDPDCLTADCVQKSVSYKPFTTNETGPSKNDNDIYGISLTGNLKLSDNLNIKSITAYRDLTAEFARAADGTSYDIFSTEDEFEQSQFSQELQLLGSYYKVDFVSGLFYFKEDAFNAAAVKANALSKPKIIPIFPFSVGGTAKNSSFAIFGEATFHLSDRLHLTGGLRYNDENKGYNPFATTALGVENVSPGLRELKFSEITWRGIFAYDLSKEMNSYLSVSKGFKSGGFDVRYTSPTSDLEPISFLPETVLSYEFGFKTNFREAGLRFNISAFLSDYKNIQVSANSPGGIGTQTINGAKAIINGIELEFDWVPTKNLAIDGSLGILDAKYTELSNLNRLTTDDELIRTPKSSYSLGVSYKIDIKKTGTITPRLSLSSQNDIHFEPINNDFVFEDGYTNINIFATYKTANNKFSLTTAVINLTDERYLIAGDSNDTIGYALGVFARPINWFITAKYSF